MLKIYKVFKCGSYFRSFPILNYVDQFTMHPATDFATPGGAHAYHALILL